MKWIKGIFLNKWLYIILVFVYITIYAETKNQTRYVLMFHEPSGNIYHASLTNPVYNSYLDRFNIFDGDYAYNIKSYDPAYFHYIGNINKELIVDNTLEINSVKILPNRNYVDYDQLPEIIKKPIAPIDIYEAEVTGLKYQGFNKFKMIMGDSAENLEKALKDRSDKFKQQNSKNVQK